jgi:hypothetical protein
MEKYLNQLREQIPGIPIIVSGQMAQSQHKHLAHGIELKRSLAEVLEYVAGFQDIQPQ